MRPRAAEDPMQNTWSIGRTWKPREGWSRPVLMVEMQGRMVDALADSTDEGRLRLRYASGSRQQGFDPRISEWGNPPAVMGRHRVRAGGTQGSETSQYLQERMFRE